MTTLYPLKFKPLFKEKIWGGDKINKVLGKNSNPEKKIGESWEISAVPGNLSIVSNGFLKGNNIQELIEIYMGDLVGDTVFDHFGLNFPLLIKYIDANQPLSVQVHPDDKIALKRHNSFGKTEMWYIIKADKNAELISGFNHNLNAEDYKIALNSGKLESILNKEKVKKGNVFFIPPGRVHAIGSNILLAEIQQSSDITYRIYDWARVDENGKSRELHTDLALDVLDFKKHDSYRTHYHAVLNERNNLISCNYFTTNLLEFDHVIELDYQPIDSFVIFMAVEGNFIINYNDNKEKIFTGETVLIPADLKELRLIPDKQTRILEIHA